MTEYRKMIEGRYCYRYALIPLLPPRVLAPSRKLRHLTLRQQGRDQKHVFLRASRSAAVGRRRGWQARHMHGLKGTSSMLSNFSLVRLSIRADRDSMGVSGMIFGRQTLSNRFCNAWVLTSNKCLCMSPCFSVSLASALSNVHDITISLPVIHGHSSEDLPVSVVNFGLKLADRLDNDDAILCHISRISDSIPSRVRNGRSGLSFLEVQHGIDRDALCHRH